MSAVVTTTLRMSIRRLEATSNGTGILRADADDEGDSKLEKNRCDPQCDD